MKTRLSGIIIECVILILLAIPVVHAVQVFPDLPDTIATHYNLKGEPDAWSQKHLGYFIILPSIALGLNIFLLLIAKAIHGGENDQMKQTLVFVRVFVALLFSGIALWMIASANGDLSARFYQWLSGMLFSFIAGMGWFMRNLEPNNYVGIRTSYTLRSPTVWRKTHRSSALSFIITGILGIMASMVIENSIVFLLSILCLVLLCILSYILSRRYYRIEVQNETIT